MSAKRTTREREFEFTLLLTGVRALTSEVEDALYNAGCTDATIAMRSGRIVITFCRAARSMKDAILSAIRDVRKAGIGADVWRVDDCNLVTQADIARRIERSRQLVHQYLTGKRGPGGFPGPICEITDGAPLWRWCEVAFWLWENGLVKEEFLRDAEELGIINTVLDLKYQRQSKPDLVREVMRAVEPS
ncbi:MAG: hypothetical protein WD468_06090 [Pirellulales bacterium]